MPRLIAIRLLPEHPVTAAAFADYLDGLTVTVFDASFDDPGAEGPGAEIGSAAYIAPTVPIDVSPTGAPQHDADTRIVQHFGAHPTNPLADDVMFSVATALIEVPDGTPAAEHETVDLRITLERGGAAIEHKRRYFNVAMRNGSLPGDPVNYPDLELDGQPFVSLYLYLPAPGLETGGSLNVPEYGTAPHFDLLLSAVEGVLNDDPGNTDEIADLTPIQARHVATEIVWQRSARPLPVPDASLDHIYTGPHDTGSQMDRARATFEGDLKSYQVSNDATADRLANFVFALSAALRIARQTEEPEFSDTAAIEVPVDTATPEAAARVKLTGIATVTPFEVPAAYVYALTAVLPLQVTPEQRFDLVRMAAEASSVSTLEEALHNDIIALDPNVNVAQAARRLAALGRARETGLPECPIAPGSGARDLVDGWLAFEGEDIAGFWPGMTAAERAGHFEIVLRAVTRNHAALMAALVSPSPPTVTTVDELAALPDDVWRGLFQANPALLPPFTHPGSVDEQADTFLRHMRKFFNAAIALSAPDPVAPGALPLLDPPVDDLIAALDAQIGGLDLDTFDPAANAAALDAVFPGDPEGRARFEAWIGCLQAALGLAAGIVPDALRFSVAEALWARGFIRPDDLDGLDLATFTEALVGTVAHDHAATIFANAAAAGATPAEPVGPFAPVNPWGALANCIPPKHLSPLGPVAYLKELLQVAETATCQAPLAEADATTLGAALAGRRGPIGDLSASHPNACVALPLIDIVNESLERMVATGGVPGAIHDTHRDTLGGHVPHTNPAPPAGATTHDAETLFGALPEHSTPAIPTAEQSAWDVLASDFSACPLPYNQPIDVTRSYLSAMGTSRYATMRAFTREIHDFVLDPGSPPSEFRSHQWRYPVRLPLALEYLCIAAQEYDVLYSPGALGPATLPAHYGFPTPQGLDPDAWMEVVRILSVFLERTCLDYCQFRDLVASGFVSITVFHGESQREDLPLCEPCCLEEHRLLFPDDPDFFGPLKRLSVFIRLWRRMQEMETTAYSFAELADIANVLTLFNGNTANADFMRQFAAFQMLCDDFGLLLTDPADPPAATASGASRTHLLAFWVPGAAKADWALDHLLAQIQQYAISHYHCPCRPPEFLKILRRNMDPLSRLAGFDPDTPGREWNAHPTHTLRMAELLAKIYASRFQVGELLFLFTTDPQLQGGDPYPAQTDNESGDLSFEVPDNEVENGLLALRHKLRAVEVDTEEASAWSWARIGATLVETYGLPEGDPRWAELGTHFFPEILEGEGETVASADRVYRQALPAGATSAAMWNTPQGPFRYISSTQELEISVPLVDADVIAKLARIRQLTFQERDAVNRLYMAPRELLAVFAFLFENQREAERALIEETDPDRRWTWFQRNFARFDARSHAIAGHVAEHLDRVTGDTKPDGPETALLLMRHLWADENNATAPWEDDSGAVPPVAWGPRPNGGAFHALHGVVGTGLIAEYRGASGLVRWRETRGGIDAFGKAENAANAPLPTLIPAMDTTLTAEQLDYVAIRNGFAMGTVRGTPVGGAEPFTLLWRGLLLIEEAGRYGFSAGAPTPDGTRPDFEALRRFHRWRVRLQQGQKSWVLLANDFGEEAPADCTKPVHLERGFYDITIEFERLPLVLDGPEDVCAQTTGFEIKYEGPDAGEGWSTIPHDKLFIGTGERLDRDLDTATTPPGAFGVLGTRHVISVRSMRRTMQRLFKAMLFADRLDLGALPRSDSGQSELGYMLSQPQAFSGQSYYDPGGGFQAHRADFDFNLLPVLDNYHPPLPADDSRAGPSAQRVSALFDWWERLFDYTVMREQTAKSPEPKAWLTFHEAAELHVDPPAQLLRHIDVDMRHAPLVLRYFDPALTPLPFDVTSADLVDERWTIRVWHADLWLDALRAAFLEADIDPAEPHLWASDPPEMVGLENLTRFYRDGTIENGAPRRYAEIRALNDGLRRRGRDALLAYLTAMNRIALPWGGFATAPDDLADLLLQDVEAGRCQTATRVEEAISAIQLFVDRARLGLEAGFAPGPDFALAWDRRFADFRIWQACKRRDIYRESWIGWSEEAVAQGSEAFRFLQSEMRRGDLTMPVPGGGVHFPAAELPPHRSLTLLQNREPATMTRLDPPRQGLGVMGTPDRHARPSWLAPLPGDERGQTPVFDAAGLPIPQHAGQDATRPLWFEAAVRTGRRFLRVAAASLAPASSDYDPKCGAPGLSWCCRDCGRDHPPVIDEYYFWLDISEEYFPIEQQADWVSASLFDEEGNLVEDATPQDGTGAPVPGTVWHDPEALPTALAWAPRRIVRLNWCRVHNGEFQAPRRSSEGVLLAETLTPDQPDITFRGRIADSLFFDVAGGETRIGYPATPLPGFRYDIAPDTATPLPELQEAEAPDLPGGLPAFPWFAFAEPSAPILPLDGFGTAIAVAGHLAAHCRYEEALKWLELEFPPLQGDNIWAECDRIRQPDPVPPDSTIPPDNTPTSPVPVPAALPPTLQPRPGECCCPSAPVSDTRAKRRHVTMLYAEILLSWAQALLRKTTPEAFQRARMLTDTARRILGPLPKTVVAKPGDEAPVPVRDVQLACAPLNPRLMCLYTHAEDVEAKIHACLDARRHKPCGERPYFGEDIVRQCWRLSGDPCLDAAYWCRQRSPHRFAVLIERARRAATECSALGRQLLSAYQQGDSEYLAQLNAKHQRQVGDLILEIRQDQVRASDWDVQARVEAKKAAITNLTYYQNLIDAGLLSGESQYEPLTGTATGLRAAGNVVEAIGQAMNLIPDPNVGTSNFVTLQPGMKLATIFSSAATVVNVAADIVGTVASLGLTKDGWERREDEWQHNVDLYKIEIARNEREILAAERRRDAALNELNSHRQTMENNAEQHDFLRDKFTSHELYLWLVKETAALHARCHDLALQCAWDAERAFNFERELSAERFISLDPPDSLHERLLDGDRLSLELARMQKVYEDRDRRPYELTKHISLRQLFPTAFLQLISTGRCIVDLPEWLFDCDNPGHYLRRIRTLSVSLPCVVGPYTGVHCKVTLNSSSIRVSPEVLAPDHRCCDDTGCNSGYAPLPDDPRVVHLHGAAEAIATSTGQEDSGLFQLDFGDPRYLPFEYQGAVCRLCIELPHETNRFDIDTLSDFVLHLRYTAHEGGEILRRAAWECARRHLPGAGTRFVDARREMPGQWRRMAAPARHGASAEAQSDYLGLHLDRGMFPFLTGNRRPRVTRIEVLFEAPDADPSRHHDVIFFAGERVESIAPDTCREGVFTVDCVSDAAWPGFFHGVLEIDPVEIAGRDGAALGVLAFDPTVARLCNVWLLFGYDSSDAMSSCPAPQAEMEVCP
ncbi:hypothetical protein SAMN05444722_1828 [Rhodovulum sp. ES.010]|uniref:Tc toxin subunit A-related protein n=1 Tax=Rhodovulum sp. ES.010 TaxID=1882821 RepID=UPI00092CC55F|nr:neuraminidase-like domain-containing protein [Rhodovulum sp. ES.010]SIO38875.1 hypothetical protein SAMN05444722_1828 [Rhodovulum sp. ES.010]